ncbi:MAG: GspH/FimT family protein [Gammaproteobacteria bacterium]
MRASTTVRSFRAQRGFTFGEVLATLGVLGVSLSLVVPSMESVTRDNQRADGINALVGTLHAARNEAITRNVAVVVCPSADGRQCTRADWDSGWIRFADLNGDYRADPDETVSGVSPAVPGLRIQSEAFRTATGFSATGRTVSPDADMTPGGDFTFCQGQESADARVLVLSALGNPSLTDFRLDGRDPDCSTG